VIPNLVVARPPPMTAHRLVAVVFLGLVALCIAMGASWLDANLGDVPSYGDTREYFDLAQTLKVDAYRGIAYPALIRLATSWWGPEQPVVPLQLFQCALALASLAYAICLVGGAVPGVGSLRFRAAAAALLALLFLDPLVAHFNLSLLTDGLALSGSLVFCTAVADFGLRRSPPLVAGALLLASHGLTAGLRAEKNAVLLATALCTMALWLGIARLGPGGIPPGLRRRLAGVLVLVAVGCVGTFALHRAVRGDHGRWPLSTQIVHQRIIFPRLSSVYDELPDSVRARLSRQQARTYDRRIHNTWSVIDRITRSDSETRERLTWEIAPIALRRHWARIALDVVTDTLENVFATASYQFRLARWMGSGKGQRAFRDEFDTAAWTYTRFAQHEPLLSAFLAAAAGASLLVACCLCAVRVLSWLRGPRIRSAGALGIALAPFAALCLTNAVAFASTADLVHVRYALFAHTVGLAAVYACALCQVLAWLSPVDAADPQRASSPR
jgi:cation transport regulator ChaB